MRYNEGMAIEHQILTDANGNPVAAQIPWDEFQELQALRAEMDDELSLSDEYKVELDRRVENLKRGTSKGISHEEVMSNLRTRLEELDQESGQRSA